MKKINNPSRKTWPALAQRPAKSLLTLEKTVRKVFADVQKNGDAALKKYTLLFDKVAVRSLKVSVEELAVSRNNISKELKAAIQLAKRNIETFHAAQKEKINIKKQPRG